MSILSKFVLRYQLGLWLLFMMPFPLLIGCTTHYTASVVRDTFADLRLASDYRVSRSAQWTLNPNTRLYLARGAFSNPALGADTYPRLNNAIFDALAHSLSQVFPAMDTAVERQSLANALAEARIANAQVLVYPSLVFMNDERNSLRELSEGATIHADKSKRPDKLAFKVVLVEVHTGSILDVALITGRDKMFTLGNDGPIALLPDAALAYTQQLSGSKKSG